MTVIELSGRINDAGELEVILPSGLPSGEVRVLLELPSDESTSKELSWEQRPWTDEEMRDFLMFEPAANGAEIIAMLTETDGWWKNGFLNNVTDDG